MAVEAVSSSHGSSLAVLAAARAVTTAVQTADAVVSAGSPVETLWLSPARLVAVM
ncbi:MAG: hypothetical protein ACYS5V_06945 [Planctomycetota bacterium]